MIDAYKETAEAITLHGLGFLQVKLPANRRLHVWHRELPRRWCHQHSQVHDHRFAFNSLVLVGTQINVIWHEYDPHGSDDIPPTHVIYLHDGERTKFGNRPWIPDGERCLTPQVPLAVPAGKSYDVNAFAYHATTPGGDGRVATLMTKTWEGEKGAHSACAIGIQPHVDFDRNQWTETQLWEVVRDVLGGWSTRADARIAAAIASKEKP